MKTAINIRRLMTISLITILVFAVAGPMQSVSAGPASNAVKGRKADNELQIYVVKPISGKRILPDTFPVPGRHSAYMALTATPGEYEPASVVLRAEKDIVGLKVSASDLENSRSAIISSENIDIKFVKCWYQAATAWSGIHTRRDRTTRILVPELLLKDDSLVKVDHKEQKNYLKLNNGGADKYVWINNPNEPDGDKMKVLSVEEYPVKDSASLLPLDMPARTNKQLWFTVHVPEDAQEGLYEGKVSFRCKEKVLVFVELRVRVLPFKLADPMTNYDLNKDFESSIYYRAKLNHKYPKGSISSEHKSEEQLRAELKNMFIHGITNPTCYQGFDEELLKSYLRLRQEAGIVGRPFYYLGVSANSSPSSIKKLLKFVKSYGIDEVYFYGIDEARGDRLKSQRAKWEATRRAGGKVFVAGGKGRNFEAMGDIQDLHICAGPPSKQEAGKWHSVGHKVFCYANPQGGPENPELWRRNFGLLLWRADYDGACTYCYQHSFGNIWNDGDHYHYRDHILAYPTVNGVIDTIALEGYREAIDDIRYATTLRLEIKKAEMSGNAQTAIFARSVGNWLSQLNVRAEDLDVVRAKLIEHILKLTGREK